MDESRAIVEVAVDCLACTGRPPYRNRAVAVARGEPSGLAWRWEVWSTARRATVADARRWLHTVDVDALGEAPEDAVEALRSYRQGLLSDDDARRVEDFFVEWLGGEPGGRSRADTVPVATVIDMKPLGLDPALAPQHDLIGRSRRSRAVEFECEKGHRPRIRLARLWALLDRAAENGQSRIRVG